MSATTPYRILVTGSRDWTDEQELRLALISAWTPHQGTAVIIHGACPTGADAMAAEWARHYGVRTEEPGLHVPRICLAFGDSPSADATERAGIPVRRYLRTGEVIPS